jgi:polyhydroxyalkanoate synthesis regulator phasin
MARTPPKDLLSRLADAGEEAIQRLADMPGASRFADSANALRARVDELQKRVRGIDELEKRVAKLEKQVAALSKPAQAKPIARKPKAPPKPKP